MEVADYIQFHRQLGKRVLVIDGIPFSEYRKSFFWSLPRFRPYTTTGNMLNLSLLAQGALGAITMTTSSDATLKAAFCICRASNFDLPYLQPRTRTKVRRGLEHCEVRIVDWGEMKERGLAINRDALARQKRPSVGLGNENWWARQCDVSAKFEDIKAWGAYINGELTSYVHVVFHDYVDLTGSKTRVADIIHFMSDSRYLNHYPNEALIFSVTKELLSSEGCAFVVLGAGSDDPNLLRWKRHMGYSIESCPYLLYASPLLQVIKHFSPKLRLWMEGTMLKSDYVRQEQ